MMTVELANNKTFMESLQGLYGSDNLLLDHQLQSYQHLLHLFFETFHHKRVSLFSSPGRTEIGGNHTDHNHGRVLAGAVTMDNIAAASPNNTNNVRVLSEGYPYFEIDLSIKEPQTNEINSSASLVRGVMARLDHLGYHTGGFDLCIVSRVPKGSGLSSSASFEVLIGTIVSCLFNQASIDPLIVAKVGQFAENNYFGKPCGLMDQTACAIGGFVGIDFKDPEAPIVEKIDVDFENSGLSLVITDTGGDHADLSDEYASLPVEMKAVASEMGNKVLRGVHIDKFLEKIPEIRKKTGDRAILRAYHFLNDNQRVTSQTDALKRGDLPMFLQLVTESGYSSFMYNQNIYSTDDVREQSVALGLALSEMILKGRGAWRVHGGGFAGTIQAFVPNDLITVYTETLEHVFGKGACVKLSVRAKGAVQLTY